MKALRSRHLSTTRTQRALRTTLLLTLLSATTIASAQDHSTAIDDEDTSSWTLNLTPVLLFPTQTYRFGGGIDPEIRHTVDLGRARLSAGARLGTYYAKNVLGVTLMPTLRLTVPVGRMEPYVSFGLGYGWLPKSGHADVATMSRVGLVIRFSESFALGIEGTLQEIERSRFRFPSFGSMVAFDL